MPPLNPSYNTAKLKHLNKSEYLECRLSICPPFVDFSITNICKRCLRLLRLRERSDVGRSRALRRRGRLARALPILHRRGIRYMTLQGGEPLVHPDVVRLVSHTVAAGISCGVITNGWFLLRYIDPLATAGLERLIISIDSADPAEHEGNHGLDGLNRRIAEGIALVDLNRQK